MMQQRFNLQNTLAIHTAQEQKNKQPNQKWAEDLNRHFSKDHRATWGAQGDIEKDKRPTE